MVNHTEGPWQLGPSATIKSANGRSICNLSVRIDEREFSDACLIAAAPELLEALQKAVRVIEALADNDLDEPVADNGMTVGAHLQYEAPSLVFIMRAAIGKAVGA